MGLIDVTLLLLIAVVAVLVLVFHALGRVVVAAVGALAHAPWRGGRLIRSRVRDETSAT